MEVHRLAAFLAVAEELSFTRAAERLHIAASPLSRQIKDLEAELGVKLFDRTTRTVQLTPAGRALIPHAENMLASLAAARHALQAATGEDGLKVGVRTPGANTEAELLETLVGARPGARSSSFRCVRRSSWRRSPAARSTSRSRCSTIRRMRRTATSC